MDTDIILNLSIFQIQHTAIDIFHLLKTGEHQTFNITYILHAHIVEAHRNLFYLPTAI